MTTNIPASNQDVNNYYKGSDPVGVSSSVSSSPDFTVNALPVQKTQRTFKKFLEEKKTTGFGLKDRLRSWYIDVAVGFEAKQLVEYIQMPLEYIAKFIVTRLGFFLLDMSRNKDERKPELESIIQEACFYKECMKTQNLYKKFMKKPTDQSFKEVSQAFERLHNFLGLLQAEDNLDSKAEAHQLINDVLNQQLGENVAEKLLEYFAEKELTKNGGFSAINLENFYLNYGKEIAKRQDKGYGSNQNIRQIFARTVKNILNQKPEENYKIWNQEFSSFEEELAESAIDDYINKLNRDLRDVMITGVFNEDLDILVGQSIQKSIRDLYQEYDQNSSKLNEAKILQEQNASKLAEAENIIRKKKEASMEISYFTLISILGDTEQELPAGFEEYKKHHEHVMKLREQIEELAKDIASRMITIMSENREKEEKLEKAKEELQNQKKEAEQQLEEQSKKVEEINTKLQKQKESLEECKKKMSTVEISAMERLLKKSRKALKKYQALEEKLTKEQENFSQQQKTLNDIQSKLQNAENALEEMITNNTENIEKASQEMAQSYNKLVDSFNNAKNTKITFSNEQLLKIKDQIQEAAQEKVDDTLLTINQGLNELEEANALKEELQHAFKDQEQEISRLQKSHNGFVEKLKGIGYEPESKMFKYPPFQTKKFRAQVKNKLVSNRNTVQSMMAQDFGEYIINPEIKKAFQAVSKFAGNLKNDYPQSKVFANVADESSSTSIPEGKKENQESW